MLFNNNDFDFSFFEIPGSDFKLEMNRNKFVSPSEGFQRGNMQRDEYKSYKNYNSVMLQASNDREQKMLKVMEYAFAIVDLNLYLDMHPEDMEAYRLYKSYIDEGRKAEQQYINAYGPLVITNADTSNYEWLKNPWPWDSMGGNMYV